MFKSNEYFNGKVKSLAFQAEGGAATIGVMTAGEYEFSTNCREIMKVITGKLTVKLPNSQSWQDFPANSSFSVAANQTFQLKVAEDTSYLCLYQ